MPTKGRVDGRATTQMRPVRFTPNFIQAAEGSVLVEIGRTRVICTASVEEVVPPFLRNTGKGWVTSEYAMIPRATSTRTARESSTGKRSGRTLEIQRLIGRSLRTAINMDQIGERTIWIDCDVIEADGGTRTASITGSFIALKLAVRSLLEAGKLSKDPMLCFVAAVSVGLSGGAPPGFLNDVPGNVQPPGAVQRTIFAVFTAPLVPAETDGDRDRDRHGAAPIEPAGARRAGALIDVD